MTDILVLNGPNLNFLGVREPHLYGTQTLEDIEKMCRDAVLPYGLSLDFRQSNHEGELVEWIQQAHPSRGGAVRGVVINAAAYTHTSVAIHDALKLLDGVPIIEVHLTDTSTREPFRQVSYIKPLAIQTVMGQGANGYVIALERLFAVLGVSKG